MEDRNKVWLALGLGALAGGAAGYYLASDDGQKMRKKVKKQISKMDDEIRTTLKDQADAFTEKMNEVAENTKSWIGEASREAHDVVSTTSKEAQETVDNAQDSMNKGKQKAARNLEEKWEQIERIVANGKV